MKRIIKLLFALTILLIVNQQLISQTKIGGGIFYGGYLNKPGINLRADIPLFGGLAISPAIDLSVPRVISATFLNSASLHLRYKIEIVDQIYVYPFAGATLKSYLDFDDYGNDRIYHRFALNPSGGGGAELVVSQGFSIFGEGRLELGRYSQFVATVGVLVIPSRL